MQTHPTFDEIMRVLVNIASHSRHVIAACYNTLVMSQPTTSTGGEDDPNKLQQWNTAAHQTFERLSVSESPSSIDP